MVPTPEENPYAAPKARVRQPQRDTSGRPLASRISRLLAVIIDSVVGMVIAVPFVLFMMPDLARVEENQSLEGNLPPGFWIVLLVLGAFMLLQLFLLWTRSQTLGKVAMKIRIDEFESDERAGPLKTLLLRGFVIGLISSIPLLGSIFALVNILFIFREDRRCIHDLIAGTVVREAP